MNARREIILAAVDMDPDGPVTHMYRTEVPCDMDGDIAVGEAHRVFNEHYFGADDMFEVTREQLIEWGQYHRLAGGWNDVSDVAAHNGHDVPAYWKSFKGKLGR